MMQPEGGLKHRWLKGFRGSEFEKSRENSRPIQFPIPEISSQTRPRAIGVSAIAKDQNRRSTTVCLLLSKM
jgi:hypothetical protein